MTAELSRTAGGTWNPPEHEYAGSADGAGGGKEYILRHGSIVPSRTRQRSASCPLMLKGQPRPSISPLVSWDDSTLNNKSHFTRTSLFDNQQDFQSADYQCENSEKAMHGIALSSEEDQPRRDQVQMGITIRRTENLNVLTAAPVKQKRLLHPDDYFQELDDLGSKILENSSFNVYKGGGVGTPFDGKISWQTRFLENASFQQCTTAEILRFCEEVTILATEDSFDSGISGGPGHYTDQPMHDRYIAHLNHLIEYRNVISAVWENVKRMESEAYCGHFISLLVLDRTRHGVARLVRIECSRIQQFVIDFELCLLQVMSLEPNTVLAGVITEVSKDVSAACRDLLTDLNMNILDPGQDIKDIWRCAVHVLDMAALSYAGAHTQFFGNQKITSVALPGPFLETRYLHIPPKTFLVSW